MPDKNEATAALNESALEKAIADVVDAWTLNRDVTHIPLEEALDRLAALKGKHV